MATTRNRKKNKFKVISSPELSISRLVIFSFFSSLPQFIDRSASAVRDKFSTDPAFTDDVRHLALPARRNSGPEAEALKMFGKKKSKSGGGKEEYSSHYSLRLERRKSSTRANNYSAEYLCKNSSSSESLDNLISYKMRGRKGFSLDRTAQSFDIDPKPQVKPKRSSWFLRDKSRDKQSKNEKFLKRASLDFSVTYDTKQVEKPRSKNKTIQRQNAADYTGDSSTTTPQEEVPEPKKSGLKRFLKGEIGIRSFNYYLLKEGLKKNQGKQKQESITTKPSYKSKSEENIYEEIYFRDLPTPRPKTPPALPPFNKQSSVPLKQKKPLAEDGNCMNCEICLQEAQEKHSACGTQNCNKCPSNKQPQKRLTSSLSGSEGYAHLPRKVSGQLTFDFFQQQQQQGQSLLQFQSYNPNNPNVYKMETTPVAFDYTSIEEQIYQMELNQQYARAIEQQSFSGDGKIMPKSSSSSDSIKGQTQRQRQQQQLQSNEFYTRPNFSYSTNDKPPRKDQIYKTDSSNSIRSENSLNKIYNSKNSSQKSNKSGNSSNHNRDETQIRQDMSDSSLGDSLFSSDANKRYFGSSESCRFNYECRRRCSLENEKCSFSDTCRNECNLRNCDCSSSYFSSDFDDTNVYNTTTNTGRAMKPHHQQSVDYQPQQIFEQKTNRYAEDFIKHVSNVKRRSQNVPFDANNVLMKAQQMLSASIYEVPKLNPKRLDTSEHDQSRMSGGGGVDKVEVEKTLNHSDDRANHDKATGTVPKLSSISSTESKKKSGQRKDKQTNDSGKKQQANENESFPKVKVLSGGEREKAPMISQESSTVDVKMTEKEKSAGKLDLQSKNEQQRNAGGDDDDDEVFLESKSSKERDANEIKAVSIIASVMRVLDNVEQ